MGAKMTQNGPEMVPKWSHTDPNWSQNGPKMDPNWSQTDPEWAQNGPKLVPKVYQHDPNWSQNNSPGGKTAPESAPNEIKHLTGPFQGGWGHFWKNAFLASFDTLLVSK
jgi:hypothetical protein